MLSRSDHGDVDLSQDFTVKVYGHTYSKQDIQRLFPEIGLSNLSELEDLIRKHHGVLQRPRKTHCGFNPYQETTYDQGRPTP